MPSLHALFVLAWALIRTLVARLFGQTRGLKEFHENYDADRLPSATKDERDDLPRMSGCIACGLCDLGARGAMELALVGQRATTDADAAETSIARLDDDVLRAKEAICPTRVPLLAIARLVRARA